MRARGRIVAEEYNSHESGCFRRTCSKGGVCSKHCNALLRKQVFPVLFRPQPIDLPLWGQVVSIEPV